MARQGTTAFEDVDDGQRPDLSELARKASRGDVAALPRPFRVAWNRHEAVDRRAMNHIRNERGSVMSEPTPPTFLPRTNKRPSTRLVHDRRVRRSEREPPSRALGAATHGPRAG